MDSKRKRDDYYSSLIDNLQEGKDSIFEFAKIVSYDSERLVARIYTLTSKQYRDDVPVLFSSMSFNTGILSPPATDSTMIVWWAPERQPYLLPMQLMLPNIYVQNGEAKVTASPSVVDEIYTLRNIQGGEHLIRSKGEAYAYFKNSGDVEIGTSQLHRFSLSSQNGIAELMVDRIRSSISNGRFYFGPASMDSNEDPRTFYYFEFEESTDPTNQIDIESDEEFLERILNKDTDALTFTPQPRMFIQQMGHVFQSDGQTITDSIDGSELFLKEDFAKNNATRTRTISKNGAETIVTRNGSNQTTVRISSENVSLATEYEVDGEIKKTEFEVTNDGKIVIGNDNEKYDLLPMLKWFYEEKDKVGESE